ncbi:MAG: hypothetical protein ACJATA_001947 [Sphingobacteriales bacterium]|jgi:hypothetical protein
MKKRLLLAIIAISIFQTTFSQTKSDPDAYGYVWRTSLDPEGPKADWIEIVEPRRAGTIALSEVLSSSYYGPIKFNFEFPYYWYNRTQLSVNNAGYILFGPGQLGPPYDEMPMAGGQADDIIAPFLSSDQGIDSARIGAGVYLWTDFKDSLIVTWNKMTYGDDGQGSNTYQAILSRKDSSITFNYIEQVGVISNTCRVAQTNNGEGVCLAVGIENRNGNVGSVFTIDDQQAFLGISKASPLSIRFTPEAVASQNLQVKDGTIDYNNTVGSKGFFVLKDSPEPVMKANILNAGTTDLPKMIVEAVVKKGFTNVTAGSNIFSKALKAGESQLLTFNDKVPTTEENIYGFQSQIIFDDDQFKTNDRLQQLIGVVDTTGNLGTLNYSGGISAGSAFTWLGGASFTSGIGQYYEPPFYPVYLKNVHFGVSSTDGVSNPSDPIRINIYDDNGKNIFGEKDGSRGDLLYTKDLLPVTDYVRGNNTTSIDEEIQINSGGVYLALMQGGATVFYQRNDAPPASFRSYEVFNSNVFFTYRDFRTTDFLLGLDVAAGNINDVIDVGVSSIISPTPEDELTDSVTIEIELTNFGPQEVPGGFDVVYQVNTRDEVIENFPLSIPIGGSATYTFKTKAARPSAPLTQYESLCVYSNLSNDFDLNNNFSCYQTSTGIASQINEVLSLDVYPNPAHESINGRFLLRSASDISIQIVNFSGRIVKFMDLGKMNPGPQNFNLPINNLAPGIYTATVLSNEGLISKQFIKTN